MPKGKRRGSRPWKPGVRSLTSAAPWQSQRPPKRRYNPHPFPHAQRGKLAYGDRWKANREWMTEAEWRVTVEAMRKRVRPTR